MICEVIYEPRPEHQRMTSRKQQETAAHLLGDSRCHTSAETHHHVLQAHTLIDSVMNIAHTFPSLFISLLFFSVPRTLIPTFLTLGKVVVFNTSPVITGAVLSLMWCEIKLFAKLKSIAQ